jgi:hypothetical protein
MPAPIFEKTIWPFAQGNFYFLSKYFPGKGGTGIWEDEANGNGSIANDREGAERTITTG